MTPHETPPAASTGPGQAAPAGQPALSAHGLTVGHGRRPVLTDVELTVADGEILALVGPNGSGKSTLLRTLGALLPRWPDGSWCAVRA